MQMEDDKRGFTVMELFIIAIVVCIVVAVAVPRFSMARSRGKLSDMVSKLLVICHSKPRICHLNIGVRNFSWYTQSPS